MKLLLQGQMVCRLGVLLLGPANVKVLGGEVEDLVERNNQVNCQFPRIDLKQSLFMFPLCSLHLIISSSCIEITSSHVGNVIMFELCLQQE